MQRTLINGQESDCLPVPDRGIHYGDGLFETMAVRDATPCLWQRHMKRLESGCAALGIPAPDHTVMEREAGEICAGVERAVLKLIVTRGPGGQGYNPPERMRPTRIFTVSPWPRHRPDCRSRGVKVHLCHTRLGTSPALAGIKHLNRLEQVLASRERHGTDCVEGLMLDRDDHVIEGTRTNLFAVRGDELITPDLSRCGVEGVMRAVVLELAREAGLRCRTSQIGIGELRAAGEVFLSNSLIGIWPVRRLDETTWPVGPVTRDLMARLRDYPEETGV